MISNVFSIRSLLVFIFLFGACTFPLELEPLSQGIELSLPMISTRSQLEQLNPALLPFKASAQDRELQEFPQNLRTHTAFVNRSVQDGGTFRKFFR